MDGIGRRWEALIYESWIHESGIHERAKPRLVRWVLHGKLSAGFLKAALENDFYGAIRQANASNRSSLGAWVQCIRICTPSDCHGSPEKVAAWRGHRGLEGLEERLSPGLEQP